MTRTARQRLGAVLARAFGSPAVVHVAPEPSIDERAAFARLLDAMVALRVEMSVAAALDVGEPFDRAALKRKHRNDVANEVREMRQAARAVRAGLMERSA